MRNITPALGGRAPEAIAAMRRRAPFAYRRQERAVTREDHDEIARRFRPPEGPLQGTVTDIMHTGSWHTVKITADRVGGLPVDADFRKDLRAHVEPFRMAGRDLEVDQPIAIPLEIDLEVCVSEPTSADRSRLHCSRSSSRVLFDGTPARSTLTGCVSARRSTSRR